MDYDHHLNISINRLFKNMPKCYLGSLSYLLVRCNKIVFITKVLTLHNVYITTRVYLVNVNSFTLSLSPVRKLFVYMIK